MTTPPVYVGIDVSKATLDVTLRPGAQRYQVSNSEEGIQDLVARLEQVIPALVLLEATGGLEVHVTAALATAGLQVAVVNPRQMRDFAKATGKLAKTDTIDAQVLAHFAQTVEPTPRPLPDAETQGITVLVTRRRQVVTMLVAEKNRFPSATQAVCLRIQTHIAWLEQELERLGWESVRRFIRRPS